MVDASKWTSDNNILAPALHGAAITKHDTTNIASGLTRAVYVGGAGNLVAVWMDDTTTTFTAVPAGTTLPIRVKRINSTNTTAADMVALY